LAVYKIPKEFDVKEYPFEIRNEVARFLNTHAGKYTIPDIAKALNFEELKVAWVLTNLCELTTPEVIMDSVKGRGYWENTFKMKAKSPKSFDENTLFFGRVMRK
jgi:hypothetical protein